MRLNALAFGVVSWLLRAPWCLRVWARAEIRLHNVRKHQPGLLGELWVVSNFKHPWKV